ncbi:dipeptidase [Paenisporosarcina macmurdoensis]|uniref:Dipeptidase n=1 Tax=Paenisporosarcina macmurdoensis TaxID=212659 RepID=A0ABW1LDF1_9BACL
MKVIDLHCDVLYKLSIMSEPFSFGDADVIQANKMRLIKGEIQVQFFAIFISPEIPQSEKFTAAMRQIELFHSKVITPNPEIIHITDWTQLDLLKEGEIGAVLTLEGADAIGEDLGKLNALLDAGVKLVGLTWNPANAVAHGADEPSHLGLKPFGETVLEVLNERNIIVDVSHLNEQSFWDVLPKVKHVLASHSNARSLCDHPRNLTDLQAKALVEKGGHIHIVYYPPFIKLDFEDLTLVDLMNHFTHFANLVGEQHLGLGSDFDGIAVFIEGLQDASDTQQVVQNLRKHFTEDEVRGITANNFKNYIIKVIATS